MSAEWISEAVDYKGELFYLCSSCKKWSSEKGRFCSYCGTAMINGEDNHKGLLASNRDDRNNFPIFENDVLYSLESNRYYIVKVIDKKFFLTAFPFDKTNILISFQEATFNQLEVIGNFSSLPKKQS